MENTIAKPWPKPIKTEPTVAELLRELLQA